MSVLPISLNDLTMRFRHQRFQLHSRMGILSPSLYSKNPESFSSLIFRADRIVLEA